MTWRDSVKKLLDLIQWLIGVTAIMASFGAVREAPFFALGALVLGVWLLPPVRRFLLGKMTPQTGKWAKWLVPIGTFILLAGNAPEPEQQAVTEDVPAGMESLVEAVGEAPADDADGSEIQPTYAVRHVIDGDTFILENDERVRLIGINAPERGQPFYEEATALLRDLVEDRAVRLERDVSERDRYERVLAYVFVDDVFVNAELVSAGLAESVAYEPDTARQTELDATEAEARAAERGLWR